MIGLGCDAPDDSDADDDQYETQITDWIDDGDESDGDDGDDVVIDVGEDEKSEEPATEEEDINPEEREEYWNEQWKKALRSSEAMENLVKKSVDVSNKFLWQQIMEEEQRKEGSKEGRASSFTVDPEHSREERESADYRGPRRTTKKSKIPPELFSRAAVRPFTYRNLLKEIVLMRHAIIDGGISVSG